jgi:hypothetical protein
LSHCLKIFRKNLPFFNMKLLGNRCAEFSLYNVKQNMTQWPEPHTLTLHFQPEPHHFYAAPAQAPGENFYAAPAAPASAPASAPAPTLLYSKAKFLKRT